MEKRTHKASRDNTTLNQDLTLTKRWLAALVALNNFHLLDTRALHRLVEQQCGQTHYGHFQNSLTKLRYEGGYITKPPGQYGGFNIDYKRRVYQLTDRGNRALKQ